MEKLNAEKLKINIIYSESTHSWNTFVNFLISFMVDNNVLGPERRFSTEVALKN